jgi:hypothetical protein
MAITPKERRAQMIKERGKTESTGINPNSPRARLERQKSQTTKRSSITPKERRAQNIASRGDNFFTRKGTKPAISERAKKIQQAQANVEKDLPKTAIASAAASGVGAAAKKPSTAKRAMAGLSEFGKAFAAARKAGKKDFTFRDKQYAAVTKQEVSKAGASGLGDYLNKLKRSETKIAKAPGQITKKTGGTITLTGEQKQTAKEKMKARRRAMKGMAKFSIGGMLEERRRMKALRELAKANKLKMLRGQQMSNKDLEQKMKDIGSMSESELRKINRDASNMDRKARSASYEENLQKASDRGAMIEKTKKVLGKPKGTIVQKTDRGLRRMGRPMGSAEVSRLEQMMPREMERDFDTRRYKSGGSVMARGCKLGRKKPTKMY